MLEIWVIRNPDSPWYSAVALVWKKDCNLTFCTDFRKCNAHTIKAAYSLSRINESVNCLNGTQCVSSLDLNSVYWQVELEEESKPLTAFIMVCSDSMSASRCHLDSQMCLPLSGDLWNVYRICTLTGASFILMILSFFPNSWGTTLTNIERSVWKADIGWPQTEVIQVWTLSY